MFSKAWVISLEFAFELARICTVSVGSLSPRRFLSAWRSKRDNEKIPSYTSDILGYLPQGAPTSPMLSNLVMREVDAEIQKIAKKVWANLYALQ